MKRLVVPKKENSDLEHLPDYLRSFLHESRQHKKNSNLQQDIIDTLFIEEIKEVATEDMMDSLVAYKDLYMLKSFLIKIGMEKMNNLVEKMIATLRQNQYDERLILLKEKKKQLDLIQSGKYKFFERFTDCIEKMIEEKRKKIQIEEYKKGP